MKSDQLITSPLRVFLDGREVTNFFSDGVQVIEVDSPENQTGLRCFWPFNPEITLTKTQQKRLLKEMKRIARKKDI
jgi:hypothetical protein